MSDRDDDDQAESAEEPKVLASDPAIEAPAEEATPDSVEAKPDDDAVEAKSEDAPRREHPRLPSEPSVPIDEAQIEDDVEEGKPQLEEDIEEVEAKPQLEDDVEEATPAPTPPPAFRGPPIPPPRPTGPGMPPPPPPPRIGVPPRIPPLGAKPPAIPTRATMIGMAVVPSIPGVTDIGIPQRTKKPTEPPTPPITLPAVPRTPTEDRVPSVPRTKTEDRPPSPSAPPTDVMPVPRATAEYGATVPGRDSRPKLEDVLSDAPDITQSEGALEVSTEEPKIVEIKPLEAHLDSPTVVEKALETLGEGGGEARAEELSKDLEARVLSDPSGAAALAYELGEFYERKLADEARAVKAFGRALNLDPSLRPNLWAIRRVFYRRGLWPNLLKLIDAEVQYARDDYERADLLLEKARISNHRMNELDEARNALDEAVRIAPTHQGALLELERVVAKSGDDTALIDVWERLAEAVEQPARKVAYWIEVGRTAGASRDIGRAHDAFEKAAQIATAANLTSAGERVARERLRVAEEHGSPEDVGVAIEALSNALLAAFGPAGPGAEPGTTAAGERPTKAIALRLELVALRRRQAQLARKDAPEKSWEYLQQALALSPGEPIVLADLTELAEELGRYDDLAELVQNWQAVEGDPSRAMTLSIRRADALLRGGQRDQARQLLASLEAAAPGFIVLTSAAERDALTRNDPQSLAATYLAAAHAALLGTWLGPGQDPKPDPKAAATLYVQGAELLAYEVATAEAFDEARAALGKALEAVADHAPALEALTELDDLTGNVGAALDRLRAMMATAEGTAKRALIERAIRLARSHGDLEAVLELQRELVAQTPNEIGIRWRLDATLAQLGRDDERADLLEKLATDETDSSGRGTALLAAARLRERAGQVEGATDLYRQVLSIWTDDTFARESLLDLLRAQERWQELVAERRVEAKSLPDGPAARRAWREAAWVLEVRLDDVAQAAAIYDDWLARMPDDRFALEGLARCKARIGDRDGESAARGTIAETDPTINSTWLYARALERAAKLEEAAEQYRVLIAGEDPSVAATSATLALGDIAAFRADTVMRVESTAALAGRTTDARLGGALAEDSGWMYALVLEDAERAAQSFEAGIALDPTRRGAQLGAALVAARRNESQQLAAAYEGLAATVEMPEAAAALLLRGAAIAAANGDVDLANQRVDAARIAAPDDTSALLVVAETATIPHVESSNAAATVDALLARAEILEMRSTLADDAAARISWELDRAEALELAGRMREAGAVVASVLKTDPDDLRALAVLRRMAKRVGDKATAAAAAYSLSRLLGDRDAKLGLLREALTVFDGPGISHNSDYAVAALKRIVANDPGAPELDRLLELLRERADVSSLIGALTDRLTWHESEGHAADTTIPLLLERATVLYGIGETEAAIADLDALLGRSPANVEALRFRADLAFNAGEVDTAVTMWKRYLAAETRPQRRAEVELQLASVLAENTNDIGGAIEQLERVVDANPDDMSLREKLLALCLRASDWDRAVRELRSLARMRATPQEKAREELRLGLMLRDRMKDRVSARLALDRARTLDPLNLDVIRELVELLDPAARTQVLAITAQGFRDSINQNPARGMFYEKLAQVNAWQADVDARWVSLAAVEALGTPSVDQRQVLTQGRHKLAPPTRVRLDEAARQALRGALTNHPLHALWRAIAPAVQITTGVDPAKLGFGRADKIAVKKLGRYEALATALACFGLEDIELYINAQRPGIARALSAEPPILCLGSDVAVAATPHDRFLLGRAVGAAAEGVATIADLREGELAWTIAAALRAADAKIPPALAELVVGDETTIAERAKLLKKEFGRKVKATLVQLAQQKPNELADVDGFKRAALGVAQRVGLLWSGDLAVALNVLDVAKGGRAITDSVPALDLAAWSVSEDHLRLRERLGVALGGQR